MHSQSRAGVRCNLLMLLILALSAGAFYGAHPCLAAAAPRVATVKEVTQDYRQALRQTAATQAALEDLGVVDPPDLPVAFRFYSLHVDRMNQVGKTLVAHSDGMHYGGGFYFMEPGAPPEVCVIQRKGTPKNLRRVELGEEFDVISDAGGEVKRAWRAFEFDINQLYEALDGSLEPTLVNGLELIRLKAQVDGDSLQEALHKALAALAQAQADLPESPAAAPASPP
jgi:hypothetical protein